MTGFRGTLEQCLAHLFSKKEDARPALSAYVGVTLDSVQRWKSKKTKPSGRAEERVCAFLQQQGYEITETSQTHSHINGHDDKKFMLEAAAHFVSGLIPIADFLLSDTCSEEDRKKLHELAGADSVLRLTTRLRRLCSETARRQLKDI